MSIVYGVFDMYTDSYEGFAGSNIGSWKNRLLFVKLKKELLLILQFFHRMLLPVPAAHQ